MSDLFILPLLLLHLSLSADSNIKYLADGKISPKAKIEQVSWIAGHWKGEAFGGQTEEIWSKPSAGSMMCVFKLFKDNQVNFYEIEIIREVNNSLVLELKHFSKELKGWEEKNEKVSFPLVKLGKNVAYFEGMTFKKISDDVLHVFVDIEDQGKHSEVLFEYERDK
ncbi:MAG: hypothetical protein COB38_07735 [Gammaproteobacteria bacterium]|nr:MAG: hypothetical protein COB38_07735 [Gammaproteobacteria bacterium]